MSTYLEWAFEQRTGGPTSQLILILLAKDANRGRTKVTVEKMAHRIESNYATTKRAISILLKQGLITRKLRPKQPAIYTLHMEGE